MNPVVSVVLQIGESSRSRVIESIDCLLKQTVEPIEIIVVNVGYEGYGVSVSLQEDYADNRLITFVSILEDIKDNYRNYALRYVSGDYVCYMNGGETWAEDKLERQIYMFKSNENVSAVISNGIYTLKDGQSIAGGKFFDSPFSEPAGWMLSCPVVTPGQVLYKRDVLQADKFSSSFEFLSDLDAICRMSAEGNVLLDYVQNIKCTIIDDLKGKRKRFLEYEKLIFNRMYIDYMLSDRKCFNNYYHNLVASAHKAKFPVEVIQYSTIAFVRFPIANTKYVFSLIAKYIGSLICSFRNRRLLKGFSEDIRSAVLGKTADTLIHKYNIWRVKKDKMFVSTAYFSPEEYSKIAPFQHSGSSLVGTYSVPYGTLSIGEGAFAGCSGIRKIILSDTVSSIEPRAFMDCDNLESVVCSSSSELQRIDEYAFAGCTALKEVVLPNNLSYIGRGAFIGCTHLDKLTFLSSLNENRTEDDFADRVSILEPECFAGCHNLQTIRFGKASMLQRIGEYAFYNCYKLSLIWIESSLEAIEDHAFDGCKNVSDIVMPKLYMINTIGKYAFAGCQKLKWFTVPSNVTVVDEGVFKGCKTLSNCPIPPTVTKIRKYAFSDCLNLLSCVINNRHAKVSRRAFDENTKIIYNKSEL